MYLYLCFGINQSLRMNSICLSKYQNLFFMKKSILVLSSALLCFFSNSFAVDESKKESAEKEESVPELEVVSESHRDTSLMLLKADHDTMTVIESFIDPLLIDKHDHYHILYEECRIEPEIFIETDSACSENPFLSTMEADSAFWMNISPYYNSFSHKH